MLVSPAFTAQLSHWYLRVSLHFLFNFQFAAFCPTCSFEQKVENVSNQIRQVHYAVYLYQSKNFPTCLPPVIQHRNPKAPLCPLQRLHITALSCQEQRPQPARTQSTSVHQLEETWHIGSLTGMVKITQLLCNGKIYFLCIFTIVVFWRL